MKKLMITACAVALVGFAQAATIKWSANAISTVETQGKAETTALSGAIYYCFLSADPAEGAGAGTVISVKDATAYAKAGEWKKLAAAAAYQGTTTAAGGINTSSIGNYAKGDDVPTGFAIIIDSDNTADAEYYMVTDAIAATTFSKDTTASKIMLGSQAANEWKEIESVPEPFSGALALLGMGAIALRRKMKKAKKA